MWDRLGRTVVRHARWIVPAWLVLPLCLWAVAPRWDDVTDDGNLEYLPQNLTSVRGEQLAERAFPGPSPLLERGEVLDWQAFAAKLVETGKAAGEAPSLWSRLDAEPRAELAAVADGRLPDADRERTLRGHLNRLLQEDDFPKLFDLRGVDWQPRKRARPVRGIVLPSESMQAATMRHRKLLEAAFPGLIHPIPAERTGSQAVIVLEREDGPLSEDDLLWFDRVAEATTPERLPDLPLVSQWSRSTPILGDRLVSEDRQAALIVLGAATEFMEVRNRDILHVLGEKIERFSADPAKPAGLKLGISGSAAIGGDMIASAAESIRNTELTTILLVLLMLIAVYRAPLLVFIPLVTIGVSVFTSFQLCALLAIAPPPADFRVFTTSKVFIVVILFGAGTDFCLFLIARCKEHLGHGMPADEALSEAVRQVGHVLAASALTTVLGLGVMIFASFGKYRYSGPTIAVCLLVALLACLTLAPALLKLCGEYAFWPRNRRPERNAAGTTAANGTAANAGENSAVTEDTPFTEETHADPGGWWRRITAPILSHPGVVLATTVLLLLPLAWKARETTVSFDLVSDLRADRTSVIGTRMLGRHFPKGDHGPVVILARVRPEVPVLWKYESFEARRPVSQSRRAGSTRELHAAILAGPGLAGRQGRKDIADLTRKLHDLREPDDEDEDRDPAGVADVRSLTEPLGGPPGVRHMFSVAEWKKFAVLRHRLSKDRYLSPVPEMQGKLTRFEVILAHDPFSREAMDWVGRIDRLLLAEAADPNSPWYGAQFDLAGTTATLRDLDAVTASDLRLLQPLVIAVVLAVLIVLLQDIVTGIYLMLSVLFSYFVTLGLTWVIYQAWNGPEFTGLDWKVPLFLFVILVAVGMDYNIYLVTRVVEEQRRFGPIEGIRRALVLTGGIITSCGLIMAGTFVSMMTGSLQSLSQLGFALSFGVLLDTLVVRTFLVPAFLVLWQRHVVGVPETVAPPPWETTSPPPAETAPGPSLP